MNDVRTEWLEKIRLLREQISQCWLSERFEEGDRLKTQLSEMERHAANRGWKLQ